MEMICWLTSHKFFLVVVIYFVYAILVFIAIQ